jgi:hypothetical protein
MSTGHRDVSRLLGSYSRRVWETWAQARGLDPKRHHGPQLQTELAKQLLSPAQLKAALLQITADERTALARVALEGGKIPPVELKAQLVEDGVENSDAAITSLMARGLLFYDRAFEGYSRWELWSGTPQPYTPSLWLPTEIGELVTIPEDLGRLPLQAAPDPPEVREGSFAGLQRDLYLLIQAVRENPVKLLKSGEVGKRESERLLQILPKAGAGENDPTAAARAEGDWFQFLWLLIQRAELVRVDAGRVVVSEAGLTFLAQSETEQAHRLIRAWVNLSEWDEFYRVPSLEFDPSGYGDIPSSTQLVMARLTLIELLLRERPYPGWYSVTSLLASMRRFRVGFLIPRGDTRGFAFWGATRPNRDERKYHGFYAAGSSPHRYFDKDKDWELVEGAFLRTVLEEPLLWLGIVRLGYSQGKLVSFQFTERGAVAVGLIESSTSTSRSTSTSTSTSNQRALVVQPNFEVVVYPEVAGISLLVELDRFAERVKMDRAALYRLTRADLCCGLQSGLTLAEITRALESYNAGPLPQNVAYSLVEWERLYNRIHVHRSVSLIEAADDAELSALRALPELKEAREIAPRFLLAPEGAALRGLRPKPEVIDYQAPIVNAIEFETATRLHVLQPTPRLQHRLQQIADPIDANHSPADAGTRGTEARRGIHRDGQDGQDKRKSGSRRNPVDPVDPVPALPASPLAHRSAAGEDTPCELSLSVRSGADRFELSREKVNHTARWWKWEAIHAFLTDAARAKPPAELAVRLKGWAGELAPVAVASLTLLAAPSAEWLDEVMRLPEVNSLIVHRLSATMALVAEKKRAALEAALAAAGVSTSGDVQVQDLLAAEARAAAEAGETLLVGPPRKRRALIERAIVERKRIAIALISYNGRLTQTKVDPLRIEGEGASARLAARMEGLRYEQQYSLNQIQGVRMLDESIKS